jgi:hypothetical protein
VFIALAAMMKVYHKAGKKSKCNYASGGSTVQVKVVIDVTIKSPDISFFVTHINNRY